MGGLLSASPAVGGLLAATGAGLRGNRIGGPPTSPYTAGIPNLNAVNMMVFSFSFFNVSSWFQKE